MATTARWQSYFYLSPYAQKTSGETVAPSLSWTALWDGASWLSDTSARSLYGQHSQKEPVFHLPQVCGCLHQNRLYWRKARRQATIEGGWKKKRLWNPTFCLRFRWVPNTSFLNNPEIPTCQLEKWQGVHFTPDYIWLECWFISLLPSVMNSLSSFFFQHGIYLPTGNFASALQCWLIDIREMLKIKMISLNRLSHLSNTWWVKYVSIKS